ncbi:MAG: hypothetical protein AAB770_00385 [Patescibacteria group bacterium]
MTKPIVSFITIILSLGFAFFYVVPAYDLNKERRGDIVSLSKILNTSGEIKMLIDKTKKNLSSIDPSESARFEVFLPEKIDTVRFANNIQYIGRKNRIILSDIKVDEPANASPKSTAPGAISATQGLVNTVSLGAKINQAQGQTERNLDSTTSSDKKYINTKASFSFTTSYETAQLFLNDLEKSLGLIDITSVSFIMLPSDSKLKVVSSPIYKYTVTVETYSLK